MNKTALLGSLLVLCGVTASADGSPTATSGEEACMQGPLEQFGRYIGDWKIDNERLARDGSEWQPGKGARWIFKCIGDGTAIQDFWYPNGGGFGTNLRSYNPDTESWEIVWAASTLNGLMHISAKQNEDGDLIMDILSPEQNPPRRIIFFEPLKDGWKWAQEWSFDDGKTWVEVGRINATPWQGARFSPDPSIVRTPPSESALR